MLGWRLVLGFAQLDVELWGRLKRSARDVRAQCAHSATIWASGRTRDPYFEILGAPRGIMVTPSGAFDF